MSALPNPGLRCELVEGTEALRALEPEWRQLYARTPEAYAASGFEWCLSSAEALAVPDHVPVLCVVIRESGNPVLLWPWILERRKRLWREATPLNGWIAGFPLPLVTSGGEAFGLIRIAMEAIGTRCDLLRIPRVPDDSLLRSVLNARGGFENIHQFRTSEVRFEEFPDWNQYRMSRQASELRDLRRRRRRLLEAGAVTLEPVLETSRCPEAIDWILRHKRAWARTRDRANPHLHTEGYRQLFLRAAAARSSGEGTLVSTLALEGRLIAGMISQVDRARIGFLVSTYDPAYGRFAPGQLLFEDMIRWACERRLTAEFRIGGEAYKDAWVNRHGICRTVLGPAGAWGRSYFRFKSLLHRLGRKG
ncbi:MAG: GNAT family N-acetyltransferase [Verrucomicrobiales bacterium]|nr:GNAT family N-acetyltransferase [Verrucomicrobiales bacterium]